MQAQANRAQGPTFLFAALKVAFFDPRRDAGGLGGGVTVSLPSGEGHPESGEDGADCALRPLPVDAVGEAGVEGGDADPDDADADAAEASRARSRLRACLLAASRRSFSALSK